VLFWFGLFGFFSLWWDNDKTTSEPPSTGLEAEALTQKLLRLKLYYIWTWRFFYYLFIYLYFYLFFQSTLCLSNACSAYCWLVTIFPCLYLWDFFVSFFYLFVYLFFPFSLTFLVSLSSHPSILNITIVIITS
jgi:hypothetical protein